MWYDRVWRLWTALIGLVLSAAILAPQAAEAQTVLGDQIRAEARYVRASGCYLESAAIARKINAEAVAIEIEDSIKAVDAYWKRKRIWEEEFHKRNPTHIEWEAENQKRWDTIVRGQYQYLLKGDVTAQLNWLLRELSGPALAAQYASQKQMEDPQLNPPLLPRDIHALWVTDGGRRGGKFVFRLSEPKILETPWPWALRAAEFNDARARFTAARDAALKEIQQTSQPLSRESGERLIQTANDLLLALQENYPPERRKTPAEFLDYSDAKRFLQTLAMGIARTIRTADLSLFQKGGKFSGETTLDLIQYMYQNGLLFAKAPDGSEASYGRLFTELRNMYVTLVADKGAQ